MAYVSTGMGDHFSALPMSLMALQLTLVKQNNFQPYLLHRILLERDLVFYFLINQNYIADFEAAYSEDNFDFTQKENIFQACFGKISSEALYLILTKEIRDSTVEQVVDGLILMICSSSM